MSLMLAGLLGGCQPKNSGGWKDCGVVWSRQWGGGAVGAFSTIGLYKVDGEQIVKGPEVGANDIGIKRRDLADGTIEFIIYQPRDQVVFRLNPKSRHGLAPFEMVKIEGTRFIVEYDWAGTSKARDIQFGMTSFPR